MPGLAVALDERQRLAVPCPATQLTAAERQRAGGAERRSDAYHEISVEDSDMPVALDWDEYHDLERIDILKVLGARRAPNGLLAGQRQ